ncbi:MAG: hypothetical protein IPK73_31225 [Candidatus Obscuribacter sp.]|nr:hypothetical protein [Candidatus Obscuribacter sp.]MBK9281466.1 hypothetical protein [Candidatus Obscuribacter sp.]
MTVNLVYVTTHGVAHATDSLIVDLNMKPVHAESGKAKIFAIPRFQGAISWHGTAAFPGGWRAMKWIESEVASYKGNSPDELAGIMAENLTQVFWANTGVVLSERGMGLHFTFYEKVDNLNIPELIWITNFNSITALGQYKPDQGPRFVAQRQTFHTFTKQSDFEHHARDSYRKVVANYLSLLGPLVYQNGDILLTSLSAGMVEQALLNLLVRKELRSNDPLENFGRRALYRAEIAALTQRVFSSPEKVGVGTPCFNLIIPPEGPMFTDTREIPGLPEVH